MIKDPCCLFSSCAAAVVTLGVISRAPAAIAVAACAAFVVVAAAASWSSRWAKHSRVEEVEEEKISLLFLFRKSW